MIPSRIALPCLAALLALPEAYTQKAVTVTAEPGERHLRNIRQLTFGGNNAEAYFSPMADS